MKKLRTIALGVLGTFLLAVAATGVYDVAMGQPIGSTTLALTPGSSTVAPAIRATGAPANISINLVPKGTGTVQVNGVAIPGVGGGAGVFTSLSVTPGTSVTQENVGGAVLSNSSTNVTTTLVATEQDLFNFSVLGNTLSATNQYLDLTAWVRNAATANAKQTRLYFGATLIADSTSIAQNNTWYAIKCQIWRTGAATQKAICRAVQMANGGSWAVAAGGASAISTPAETLSGAVTIRLTGTDAVAAAGTNLEAYNLLWYPAGQ